MLVYRIAEILIVNSRDILSTDTPAFIIVIMTPRGFWIPIVSGIDAIDEISVIIVNEILPEGDIRTETN